LVLFLVFCFDHFPFIYNFPAVRAYPFLVHLRSQTNDFLCSFIEDMIEVCSLIYFVLFFKVC
jgi:hypothetical protein